jgi:hypothetical protein
MNSAPIEVSDATPKITIGAEGGMRMPSVPPPPITP